MKKNAFEYMSQNEWLGDTTTHFMKSGSVLRSPENRDQEELAKLIPRNANGVKIEYDIAFDFPDSIRGYKFSDLLTKALYLAPQSLEFARRGISSAASKEPTAEGKRVIEELRAGITDKYILDSDETFTCDELIVLPGTNLLSKDNMIDFDKIDRLVAQGAYVKMHPITERTWVHYLRNRWGSRVISENAPLYPIMKNSKKIYFPMSSESGLASVLLGKQIGIIDHPEKRSRSNFQHIYEGIDRAKNGSLVNKLAAMLSYPESGLVTTYHDDPKDRIEEFFAYMSQFPHKT